MISQDETHGYNYHSTNNIDNCWAQTRNKTIQELKIDLAALNVVLSERRQYRLAELQQIATNHNIDTKIQKTRVKKGWEGQPKGLLQVLWERGWIDEGQLEKYTIEPATDDDGEVLEGAEDWSLKCLMASCLDFAEEMTALQHVGSELGVSVIITPKFHAELAGEGIEYSWGVTKGVYHRKPLQSKRSKESFKGLVQQCTSRDILTTKTVRKLSRRARAYICAYYALYESKCMGDDIPTTNTHLAPHWTSCEGIQNPQGCNRLWCRLREWVCAQDGGCLSCGGAVVVVFEDDGPWWSLWGLWFFVRDCTSTKFLIYWVYVVLPYSGRGWNQPYQ